MPARKKKASVASIRRLAVFSHFDSDALVDDYVVRYLQGLRAVPCDIVFVSTSPLAETERRKVAGLCVKVICRENVGYDFMSYKVGLLDSGIDYSAYDEVVICNDSVYGPLFPLDGIFDSTTVRDCDFWGITESTKIAPHLQSYFLVFRSPLVRSGALSCFLSNIESVESKKEIIKRYEVGLSQFLAGLGFSFSAYCSRGSFLSRLMPFMVRMRAVHSQRRDARLGARAWLDNAILLLRIARTEFRHIALGNMLNPSLHLWRRNLRARSPFIKIQLLRQDPSIMDCAERIVEALRKKTVYPVELIVGHLARAKSIEIDRENPEGEGNA